MTSIIVTTREGDARVVEAVDGGSVMEAVRDAGIDELLALCGGCLSCATCHVFVDDDWLDRLRPMSVDEDELLDGAADRRLNSRLSCQLLVSATLDGLRVTIAPEG